MDNKALVGKPTRQTHNRREGRRRQSGQSLVEFAFSVVILVMLIAGIVDLGRAFFTKVAMDSVISEGAHWAAAFPGCIPTANNPTFAPQVPAGCRGTNSIIGRMANENLDLNKLRIVNMSTNPVNATEGQTITLSITYNLQIVTPIMQWMFGDTFVLSSQVQEVIRGSSGSVPTNPGAATDSTGVPVVTPITDLAQPS